MPNQNTRGNNDTPYEDAEAQSERRDGVHATDLTSFQIDQLAAIAHLEATDEKCYGLAIQEILTAYAGEEVHHGRNYQNLDVLAERGLITQGDHDGRTNQYGLTPAGRALLVERVQWLADQVGLRVIDTQTDGTGDDDDRTDGGGAAVLPDGGESETEWTLTCLDCDFEIEITAAGHPREGPPDVVRDRVTTHKHASDQSHIVRVEGRRAGQSGTIDPSLVTDGGVTVYECDEHGEIYRCTVDETGQRRCPNCKRAVTTVVTDGGQVEQLFSPGDHVIVENLDGEESDAVVVGYQDALAGEHTVDGNKTIVEYWRGYDIDDDEPVVAIRYAKGVTWDGRVRTWSKSTYDYPQSAVKRPETDGGHQKCIRCNRYYDRSEHDDCPNCSHANLGEFVTDGGFEELNALEQQADALEDISEQLRIQNAALVELTRTLDKLVAVEMTGHPEDARSGRSVAGWVEDAALDVEENVDLDAVDRVAEVQR